MKKVSRNVFSNLMTSHGVLILLSLFNTYKNNTFVYNDIPFSKRNVYSRMHIEVRSQVLPPKHTFARDPCIFSGDAL